MDDTLLFISDSESGVIRRLDLATATVSTYAGQAGWRGWADGDLAIARFRYPEAIAAAADVRISVGFDPDSIDVAEGHLGLVGMRERAAAVGGALAIASTPGRGTRIELRVQTDDPQEDERPIDLAMATVWSVPRPS